MTTLTPTKSNGAQSPATDRFYVEPDMEMRSATLAELLPDSVNSAFVANLLSAMLTHERGGVHLYRSVAGRTTEPDAQSEVRRVRTPDTAARRDPRTTHRERRRQPELRELSRTRRRGDELEDPRVDLRARGLDRRPSPRRCRCSTQSSWRRRSITPTGTTLGALIELLPDGDAARRIRSRGRRSRSSKRTSTSAGPRRRASSWCCNLRRPERDSRGLGPEGRVMAWRAKRTSGRAVDAMRVGRNVEVRPLGGGLGCLTMILVSIVASVVLTLLVNLLL